MTKKWKSPHVGGQQMPLLTPDSAWVRPTELPDLRRIGVVALDRETKDLGLAAGRGPGWAFPGSAIGGHVVGTALAWREGGETRSLYAPTRHPDTDNFDPAQVARWEIDHQKAGVRFVMQNAPYDVGWGDAEGVSVPSLVDDTTCMAYVIDENRREYDLDSLCEWRGVPGKDESLLDEALQAYGFPVSPKLKKQYIHRLPARYAGPYAEADAVATLLLGDSLRPEIARQSVGEAYQLEMDLLPVVHAMRKRGIRVDVDAAERAKKLLMERALAGLRELSDKMGHTSGMDELRSNSWLRRAFDAHRVSYPVDRDGKASFESKWMKNNMSRREGGRTVWEHWLPRLYVEVKSAWDASEKFLGTFVLGFAHRGRLHSSINQFKSEDGGTRTYRFSYSDPPLQQMPKRDEELAALIRGAFLPEEGELWLACDYSQQEYRLIVHYAEKLGLSKALEAAERYRRDPRTDFHSMVAEMTGLDRKPAKDSNFAKSYGAGIPKFALMINKSEAEAKEIMDQYDEKLPFNKELNQRCQSTAEKHGYVLLLDGARIHFDDWEAAYLTKSERDRGWRSGGQYDMAPCRRDEAEKRVRERGHPWFGKRLRRAECRKAMNAKIQGGAARQTKMSMRALWRAGHCPLLQMHDELDFSVTEQAQGEECAKIMREIVPLRVPMVVDAEYGDTWGDATHTWEEMRPAKRARRARRAR